MKYIEELIPGHTFKYGETVYLATCDHKSNGSKLCYSLTDGTPKWIEPTTIVEHCPVYTLDTSNNIVPVRETKNEGGNIS